MIVPNVTMWNCYIIIILHLSHNRDAKHGGKDASALAENRDNGGAAKIGNNNAVFRQLCSALQFDAATLRPQTGRREPDVETGRTFAIVAAERPKPHRKNFRSPVSGIGRSRGIAYDTDRPANRYVDPILVQETSRGVDYLTGYPVAKTGDDDDKTCYDDMDQPAEVWKTNVIGEPKSSINNNNHFEDNDEVA